MTVLFFFYKKKLSILKDFGAFNSSTKDLLKCFEERSYCGQICRVDMIFQHNEKHTYIILTRLNLTFI